MVRSEILRQIAQAMLGLSILEEQQVLTEETSFSLVNLDELQWVELVMELEEMLNIEIPDEDVHAFWVGDRAVKDLVDIIDKKLSA